MGSGSNLGSNAAHRTRRAWGSSRKLNVGERFGRWTVLGAGARRGGHLSWLVRCDCGRECERQAISLVNGTSKGCGSCGSRTSAGRRALPYPSHDGNRRHTPVYKAYRSMLDRCYDERCPWYHRYGGRGIEVCERWRDSFAAFVEDMPPHPGRGYSIERIDNDGHYEPGNCRWATAKEQARNTRRNRVLEVDGRAQCVAAWAEERGVNPQMIFKRLRLGWPAHDAVMVPPGERRSA